MKGLPSKILPTKFNCIGPMPDGYYDIDKTNNKDKFLKFPPGINPKVVSSVYGKIKTLVMFYPTDKDAQGSSTFCYFNLLKELIQKLEGGGRTFIVITEDVLSEKKLTEEKCKMLGRLAKKNGNRLCHVHIENGNKSLSAWAQDAFLAVEYKVGESLKTYLLEASNANEDKGVILEAINILNRPSTSRSSHSDCKKCEDLHFDYESSNIPFVGGNILAGNNFVLIGLSDSEQNIEITSKEWLSENPILLYSYKTNLGEYNKQSSALQLKDGFENTFNSYDKKQIIFHLDVFITLAGKNKKGEEVFVIGQPVVGFPMHKDMHAELKAMVREIITETTKAIDEMIEQLKEGLKCRKIKIVRNPLPLTYYESEKNKIRNWTWASYNNCLVEYFFDENNKTIKQVYLPSYGISSDYSEMNGGTTQYGNWTELYKYDLENQWIWEKVLEYDKCILLEHDYNQFMSKQGALNCITNCIERAI